MRILGIFRGFPGLGRVVSGVGILETLRDKYNCEVEIISYLQGKDYLALTGDYKIPEVTVLLVCYQLIEWDYIFMKESNN